MSSRDEYESHLDSLDKRFYVHGSEVHVNFSKPFIVDLDKCRTAEALLSQTRSLTVRLVDEPNVHIQYLVERLIRYASSFHKLEINAQDMANSIGFVRIDDTVYKPKRDGESNRILMRFENGVGKYAGHHFVELNRVSIDQVQITRNMIGYPKNTQQAEISRLEVVETDSHLLLLLPEPISWQFSYQATGVDSQWHWLHGTRIALRHSLSPQALSTVLSDFQLLMESLPFEYSRHRSPPAA
jgi:hypothetical protein